MEIELGLALGLLAIAFVAGAIDAIAGGGGLLTVPALLAAGLTPAQALATNKLQASFGSFSAVWFFWRRGFLQLRKLWPLILVTFAGSVLGTLLVQRIDSAFLARILPLLLIAMAVYFLLSPRMVDHDSAARVGPLAFALGVALPLGFYDGFFGPGVGSFYAAGFIALAGFGLRKATAHTKLLNFTSNLASLCFFALGGKVVWSLGLLMALGQFAGGRVGARWVFARGASLVKPLLVTLSLVLSCKLIWDLWG